MSKPARKNFFFFFILALVCILAATFFVIANGYQIDLGRKTIKQNGLLAATSLPSGAQIFVDGKLKSATDATVNLLPGEYLIELKKPGFYSWKKNILIEPGLVVKTDAFLFATAPDLKAITFSNITKAVLSPDGQRLVFGAKAFPGNNFGGLWVMDMNDRPFGLSKEPWQIWENQQSGHDFSKAELSWNQNSKEVLVVFKKEVKKGKPLVVEAAYILQADRLNKSAELLDISASLSLTLDQWQREKNIKTEGQSARLPEKLLSNLKNATAGLEFSPDETKIIYTATASATLPENILPHLPARSTQAEERNIKPGKIYVFDLKEDKNFYIADKNLNRQISWLGTSRHLFWLEKGKIKIGEYDNANWVDAYTGSFLDFYAFPFPAGNKILILTNLGQKDAPANLYSVILR